MIKGVTKSGFSFEITNERLDNFELVPLFIKADKNPIYITEVARKMLGDKQFENLKKRCTKDGQVSSNKMFKEIGEILAKSNKIKK